MYMNNLLTIIIPCKNEKDNIYECIGFIAKQVGFAGTKVIIADTLDKFTAKKVEEPKKEEELG